MSIPKKIFSPLLILVAGFLVTGQQALQAAGSVTLYTPYTRISVPPGESLEFTIDLINNSTEMVTTGISVTGMPRNWGHGLTAKGWNVQEVSILPGEKETLSLNVEVPLRVNKGDYRFRVNAGDLASLPVVVNVSEIGTYRTELTTTQANMMGHPNANFNYNITLRNLTDDSQLYSLRADVERGWQVTFKPRFQQATSVEVGPGEIVNMGLEVRVPPMVKDGTYKIPIHAVNNVTSADLDLEIVITGTFEMELTTPTGLLSTSVTAGKDKRLELLLKNNGSSELTHIEFSYSAPVDWDVIFEPERIEMLEAGSSTTVYATIRSSEKAIAGDYATNISAKVAETDARAAIRVSVKTPMLWGWVGVLIILAALGSVFYLFRKYGRR